MDYEDDDNDQVLHPIPPPQLPRRRRSLDNEILPSLPPPIPYVDAKQPTIDDDDDMMMIHEDTIDTAAAAPPLTTLLRQSSSGRRRQLIRRRRRRHRMKKEGAAVEWIQELQNASLGSRSDGKRIAESASSKFLTLSSPILLEAAAAATTTTIPGGMFVGYNNNINIDEHDDDGGIGGGGMLNPTISSMVGTNSGGMVLGGEHTVGMTPEDVVRALGMPHPLCRSSTIEAGPFTVAMLKTGGVGLGVGGVGSGSGGGGVRDSIALTSSGSGD